MPEGKPAGMRCINLTSSDQCAIHSNPTYPDFCMGLKPSIEMCGDSRNDAMAYLDALEIQTRAK